MRDRLSGGGWQAISYCLRKARQVGGWLPLYRAMRSKNTCKTCALGMGGQQGGMVDEGGRFLSVCFQTKLVLLCSLLRNITLNVIN